MTVPTPEEQEGCLISAAAALNPGGYVYVDNDHMEGELDAAWREPVPGLPRLRPFQQAQLRVTLAWAARRLDLPPPSWLAALPA